MTEQTNPGKGTATTTGGGVNPYKGIMALNNEEDIATLPKRSVDSTHTNTSSSPPSTSIRDSLFRIRSPSLKKKLPMSRTSSSSNNGGGSSPSNTIHATKRTDGTATAMSTSLSMIDDPYEPPEDDPVLALYTSRNTQKVRFSLGEVEPKERTYTSTHGTGGNITTSTSTSMHPDGGHGRSSKRSASSSSVDRDSSKFNIKKFMRGALFGGSHSGGNKKSRNEEFELEFEREMEEATKNCDNEMIWSTQEDGIPEVLRTTAKKTSSGVTLYSGTTSNGNNIAGNSNTSVDGSTATGVKFSFAEDYETRATIIKLINKARRAQFLHYRYEYAVKCYMKALEILRTSKYPEDHPTVIKTMKLLQSAHHANSSYKDSANIVKLGIKYEDSGELVRALKMYTIAYRIRSEALGPNHPSLVVLLNMLGSVQIKCGELDEAMAIYELALKDTEPPKNTSGGGSSGDDNNSMSSNTITLDGSSVPTNYVTRAVTYREMGTIYEQWGESDRALKMYHKSLDCMAEYKGLKQPNSMLLSCDTHFEEKKEDEMDAGSPSSSHDEILHDLESTHISTTAVGPKSPNTSQQKSNKMNKDVEDRSDEGGMELTFGESSNRKSGRRINSSIKTSTTSELMTSRYDIFFPPSLEEKKRKKRISVGGSSNNNKKQEEKMGDYTDVDVALTIHRIAQLHRAQQEYDLALPAFYVSLRGMKYALGKSHPNVAAILGNIGNLQKEMGDMDSAYTTYQQVLAIESYRLGLSHPDVVVTLHNISTIDAARGNHEHALSLYTQVVTLQRKLFGEDHESVAVTSACMGDVYERLGNMKSAVECYEEALRIKIMALGRHSLEVARLLHKLGKLAVTEEDFHLAHSYISKALLVYRLNKLRDDDEWVIDVNRDAADVDAAIAMGRAGDVVEC